MHQLYKMIGRLCNIDCPVLIIGEKGSGKKMTARALHHYSSRSGTPFLTVVGSSILQTNDEGLLGAGDTHPDDAVCFVPEWSNLSFLAHQQLLSIHRRSEYKCDHENRYRKHNFRFIAATSSDVRADLDDGKIPVDLFFDWNFFPLYVPPLRDHREDVPLYANHFLEKLASEKRVSRRELSPEAAEILVAHSWPGNLDELKIVMETALSNCRGYYIRAEHLPNLSKPGAGDPEAMDRLALFLSSKLSSYIQNSSLSASGNLYQLLLPRIEQSLFQYTLKKSKGNKNKAAQILGLHRNTLNKKLHKLGLS